MSPSNTFLVYASRQQLLLQSEIGVLSGIFHSYYTEINIQLQPMIANTVMNDIERSCNTILQILTSLSASMGYSLENATERKIFLNHSSSLRAISERKENKRSKAGEYLNIPGIMLNPHFETAMKDNNSFQLTKPLPIKDESLLFVDTLNLFDLDMEFLIENGSKRLMTPINHLLEMSAETAKLTVILCPGNGEISTINRTMQEEVLQALCNILIHLIRLTNMLGVLLVQPHYGNK